MNVFFSLRPSRIEKKREGEEEKEEKKNRGTSGLVYFVLIFFSSASMKMVLRELSLLLVLGYWGTRLLGLKLISLGYV